MSNEIFEYAFSTAEEFARFLKAHFKPFDGAPRPEIFTRRIVAGHKHYSHPNPGHLDQYTKYTCLLPYMGAHFAKVHIDDCPAIPVDWQHFGDKKIYRAFSNKRDLATMLRSAKVEKAEMTRLNKITASELSEVTDSSDTENDDIDEMTSKTTRKGALFKIPVEFPHFTEIKELVVKCHKGGRHDLGFLVIADFQHYWNKANAEVASALTKSEYTYYKLGRDYVIEDD
jgi:hypothetical protein